MRAEIEIPENVNVNLEGDKIIVKGPKGELIREFKHLRIKKEIKENKVIFSSELERKRIKALIGTWKAHLKNMFLGVLHGWKCKLKIVYSHFPVKVEVKDSEFIIHNFLGERKPRVAKIFGDVQVKIEKDEIIVSGINKEEVGQTAANIERAARIKGYDRRVFQDGIYITEKPQIMGEENVAQSA